MRPLRDAFIRIPITYSLKLLWWTATLFINTTNSIRTAQKHSKVRSGVLDISVEMKTPRKKGWRNRPTESRNPANTIIQRSLRDRTFMALFHNLGSLPFCRESLRSLVHCECNCFVNTRVLSSSCNGQKSDCCKGRLYPVLNKSFVHQNRRNEIQLALLCGCVEASYSPSPSIVLNEAKKQNTEAMRILGRIPLRRTVLFRLTLVSWSFCEFSQRPRSLAYYYKIINKTWDKNLCCNASNVIEKMNN